MIQYLAIQKNGLLKRESTCHLIIIVIISSSSSILLLLSLLILFCVWIEHLMQCIFYFIAFQTWILW